MLNHHDFQQSFLKIDLIKALHNIFKNVKMIEL